MEQSVEFKLKLTFAGAPRPLTHTDIAQIMRNVHRAIEHEIETGLGMTHDVEALEEAYTSKVELYNGGVSITNEF